jgi:hypothetical protein
VALKPTERDENKGGTAGSPGGFACPERAREVERVRVFTGIAQLLSEVRFFGGFLGLRESSPAEVLADIGTQRQFCGSADQPGDAIFRLGARTHLDRLAKNSVLRPSPDTVNRLPGSDEQTGTLYLQPQR